MSIDYRLDTQAKLRRVFSQMKDDEVALMGLVRCTCCRGTHRAIVSLPDWMVGPPRALECASCGEMSCMFVYDTDFRRIISSRQEREGWLREHGELFKKDLLDALYIVKENNHD